MVYSERPSVVPRAVLWQQRSDGPGSVLPDGCMDLLLTDDGVQVAGPDTEPFPVAGDGRLWTGLRFAPGRLPGLLGIKAAELRNQRVPLADLLGSGPARRVDDRLAEAADRTAALERYALDLDRRQPSDDRQSSMEMITGLIRSGRTVAEIADRTGIGERRLHRWSLQYYGYGPKTLARILRVQRALALAADGTPAAEVAVLAGFADQAHLIRDARRITGVPFGRHRP